MRNEKIDDFDVCTESHRKRYDESLKIWNQICKELGISTKQSKKENVTKKMLKNSINYIMLKVLRGFLTIAVNSKVKNPNV